MGTSPLIWLFVVVIGLIPQTVFCQAGSQADSIAAIKACDFDGDGVVGLGDFALFRNHWATSEEKYDVYRDGIVNSLDFALFVGQWGKRVPVQLLSICDRTQELSAAILAKIGEDKECGDVTVPELLAFRDTLDLSSQRIPSLKKGDFDSLKNVTILLLDDNQIATIEKGSLSGLSSVQRIFARRNMLVELPDSAFWGLDSLRAVDFTENPGVPFPAKYTLRRIDGPDSSSVRPAVLEVLQPFVLQRDWNFRLFIRNRSHGIRKVVTIPAGKSAGTVDFHDFVQELSHWRYRGDNPTKEPPYVARIDDRRFNTYTTVTNYTGNSNVGHGLYGFLAVTTDTLCLYTNDCGGFEDPQFADVGGGSSGGGSQDLPSQPNTPTANNPPTITQTPGRPDAPTVTALSASSLSVSWSAPANLGPAISDYDVRYKASDGTFRDWPHTGISLNATITGLDASTNYEVQVRAYNSDGIGHWSASGTGRTSDPPNNNPPPKTNPVKPGKPDAPTIVVTGNNLTVSWSAPSNNGPAITNYDVRHKASGGTFKVSTHGGSARRTNITGLSANTDYEVQVRAKNSDGAGPWSNSATATTGAEIERKDNPFIAQPLSSLPHWKGVPGDTGVWPNGNACDKKRNPCYEWHRGSSWLYQYKAKEPHVWGNGIAPRSNGNIAVTITTNAFAECGEGNAPDEPLFGSPAKACVRTKITGGLPVYIRITEWKDSGFDGVRIWEHRTVTIPTPSSVPAHGNTSHTFTYTPKAPSKLSEPVFILFSILGTRIHKSACDGTYFGGGDKGYVTGGWQSGCVNTGESITVD